MLLERVKTERMWWYTYQIFLWAKYRSFWTFQMYACSLGQTRSIGPNSLMYSIFPCTTPQGDQGMPGLATVSTQRGHWGRAVVWGVEKVASSRGSRNFPTLLLKKQLQITIKYEILSCPTTILRCTSTKYTSLLP